MYVLHKMYQLEGKGGICIYNAIEQNHLLFRTPPGALAIPAGESIRLTAKLNNGVQVANDKTIRVYSVSRSSSDVPVTITIFVLQVEAEELIFALDSYTQQPGSTVTRTYDVPGRALVVFATGGEGTGHAYIDFGILGFGPPAYSSVQLTR